MTQTADETVPALDFSDFDDAVRVQDDLYRHVNGAWLAADRDPRGQADGRARSWSSATPPRRPYATSSPPSSPGAPGSEAQKIADLYASFMDADAVEAAGAAPLAGPLAAIAARRLRRGADRLVGRHTRQGVRGLFDLEAESDPGDPTAT